MKKAQDINYKLFNKPVSQVKNTTNKASDWVNPYVTANNENIELLEKCRYFYNSLDDARKRAKRGFNFYRGKQYEDLLYDKDTDKSITEAEYLKTQGRPALTQNLIRQTVKHLIGQYRNSTTKSIITSRNGDNKKGAEMISCALEAVHQTNMQDERNARNFEEFMLSGMPFVKTTYSYNKLRNRPDIMIRNPDPRRMFLNTDVRDIQYQDLRLIGEIHDLDIDTLISIYAKNPAHEEWIKSLYLNTNATPIGYSLDSNNDEIVSFYTPKQHDKCRVFEVWYLKTDWRMYIHDMADGSYAMYNATMKDIERENNYRIKKAAEQGIPPSEDFLMKGMPKKEQFWYVKYLTPTGHVLHEQATPYEHEEHPYTFLLYPLIRGEVWGFVEDVIGLQKTINRMFLLNDFIINTGAKNTLLIPKDCLNGQQPEDFADQYRRVGGVIVYTPSATGRIPEQIQANSSNFGINEMIQMQMSLFQDISGVQGAAQGQQAKSGTASSLYAQMAQNSTTNTVDYMKAYSGMLQRVNMKIVKLIKQYYTQKEYISVAGSDYSEESKIFDPQAVIDTDFDCILAQTNDTPAYKGLIDDFLMQLLQAGAIDVEMMLESTSMPFATKLLETIKKRKEEMANQQPPSGIDPALMQEISGQANTQGVQMALKGVAA
jgi:hypothetical protein